MNTAVVNLQFVSKHYGSLKALDQLNLSVCDGEVIGLLGHNGAGKSTTMKLLLGIITPTSGKLHLFGQSPSHDGAKTLRYRVGYLPESVSFYDLMSGREVLTYFARLKGVDRRDCDQLLARVGLDGAADRRVSTYSKGMRQRLGLAQALLGDPRLLLLDEPTAGLDPLATREFYQTIDELRRLGTTIILSSHVLAGIEQHIDRAVILRNGRLQASGSLFELRQQARLPLFIKASGKWPEGCWSDLQSIATIKQEGEGEVLIQGRLEDKIELTRRVLAQPGINNFDLHEPNLEALYSHFSSEQAGEVYPDA